MPRLSIYNQQSTTDLIDKYELAITDLTNAHVELAELMSTLHIDFLNHYAEANGKSVAEKNRAADFATKFQYAEILKLRGQINRLTVLKDMLANIISWRTSNSSISNDLTIYPIDYDKEKLGHG